jgi:copper resistance protein B
MLPGLIALMLALPAAAQDHAMHDMRAPASDQQTPAPPVDPHAGHDMSSMQPTPQDMPDPHAGHAMPERAPAPVPAEDRAADRYWGAAAMARAERSMRREHGGGTWHQLRFDLAEYQVRRGRDGYRWDAEAWIGGNTDRLAVKTEGSGGFGSRVDNAQVQALYSRALDPYWNLQAGLRQDLGPGPRRTYAAIGLEGLAPYWFDLEGTLFLSTEAELLARIEASYDQRITQDLVLQPRAELELAAQDVPEDGLGAGLSEFELGVRLRYERDRAFAPYVGVSWDRKLGRTADFTRLRGDDAGGASFVAGIRAWF